MSTMQEHTSLPEPGNMPFQLPAGYFDALPQILLLKVRPQQNSATPPDGYFDQLPDRLLQRIRASAAAQESDDETPSLLQQLPRSMPFAVPDGYFEQPVGKVPIKVAAPIRLLARSMQWAVAACLIGLLGLSLWLGYRQGITDASRTDIAAALADLPDDALNQAAEPRDISLTNPFRIAVGWQDASAALGDFTDAELDTYLQQSGLNVMYSN